MSSLWAKPKEMVRAEPTTTYTADIDANYINHAASVTNSTLYMDRFLFRSFFGHRLKCF